MPSDVKLTCYKFKRDGKSEKIMYNEVWKLQLMSPEEWVPSGSNAYYKAKYEYEVRRHGKLVKRETYKHVKVSDIGKASVNGSVIVVWMDHEDDMEALGIMRDYIKERISKLEDLIEAYEERLGYGYFEG